MSTEPSKEEKEFIAGSAVLIQNTNLESMLMIKNGILAAINTLQQYQDPKGILCLKENDVLKAIEDGYTKQVAAYETLRNETFAKITEDTTKDNNEKIAEIHKITEDVWARAKATPLPASNTSNTSNTKNNSGYNTNSENKLLSIKKLKSSEFRKPPHRNRSHKKA